PVGGAGEVGPGPRREPPPALTERLMVFDRDRLANLVGLRAVGVAALVDPRQAVGRCPEGCETDRRVVPARLQDRLQRRAIEPAVPAGGREGGDPAPLGPPPERAR